MMWQIIVSSILMAGIVLTPLAMKWCIKLGIAVPAAIIIGAVAGVIVSLISANTGLVLGLLVVIEFPIIMALTAIVLALRFYRDPERTPPGTENVILAPADGTVIYASEVDGSSLVSTKKNRKYELTEIMSTDMLADAAYLVGIDMNFLNVHVNRSPVAGKIALSRRVKGRFISLRRPESMVLNERRTTVIDQGSFKVGVVQISSRLVRKIVSYLDEGQSIGAGERLGAILFGSQVDTVIPALPDLKIKVKPGDEVKAGVSVIATYGK